MRTSCLAPGSMAYHLVVLPPVSSSDAVSRRGVQSEGSKAWTRESRSRNLVSAAWPEVSGQWQTNSVPTSLEADLAAFLTMQSLAPFSFTVGSEASPFVLAARRSPKEFIRATNAFLRFWHKSSQTLTLAATWGTTFGAAVFGAAGGGCFTR